MGAFVLSSEPTVPITARLSRKFYDTLGDEVTNELVTWLNAVDQSYREEFRELFAANFGRLQADFQALEARLFAELAGLRAELRTELHREIANVRGEIAGLRGAFAGLRDDVARLEGRLDRHEQVTADSFERQERAITERLDSRFDTQDARLGARAAAFERRLTRWMVTVWLTSFGLLAGMVYTLNRLG